MIFKEINKLSRELFLDKKNRSILCFSEHSKINFRFLYEFAKRTKDKDAQEVDEMLKTLNSDEAIIFNDMLPNILHLCKEEWTGDFKPVEIINDERKRKNCSLCGTKNNKWVFNIKNKLNNTKMNVGSTCITEFSSIDLKQGYTKSKLMKEALKQDKLRKLTIEIPNVERMIKKWNTEPEKFPVLIPNSLVDEYEILGEKTALVYEKCLDGKIKFDKALIVIKSSITQQEEMLSTMNDYSNNYSSERYIVTRAIVNYLLRENDVTTIEKLKITGFVAHETAENIKEPVFLEKFRSDMNVFLNEMGIEISGLDQSNETFELSIHSEAKFKMFCTYSKFIRYFGSIVFGERDQIKLNKSNIFLVCDVFDIDSYSILLSRLNEKAGKGYNLHAYENKDLNLLQLDQLDIREQNGSGKVYVVSLKKFMKEFKKYAFIEDKAAIAKEINEFISKEEKIRTTTIKKLNELRRESSEVFKQ